MSESSHESLDVLYRGHVLRPCRDFGTMEEDPWLVPSKNLVDHFASLSPKPKVGETIRDAFEE